MFVGNYLIEMGNQKCILPDGTTDNTESKLHPFGMRDERSESRYL